jgi:hypothetical protein
MWSTAPSRSILARNNGPAERSNGACASSVASLSASLSRSGVGRFSRCTTGTLTHNSGAITCTGRAPSTRKVVRSDSWRRTISFSVRSSRSMSIGVRTGIAAGTL